MADDTDGNTDASLRDGSLETTATLLTRARLGDAVARNLLAARYYPRIERWAHGRLPLGARHLMDTGDLVQECLLKALDHLKGFEPRHEGAFMAFLRQIVKNRILDEIRAAKRNPGREGLSDGMQEPGPTPLEVAMGKEAFERYEAALEVLSSKQREAVVLRVEMEYSYPEVAEAMELPSANAARMLVARGLLRLGEAMS